MNTQSWHSAWVNLRESKRYGFVTLRVMIEEECTGSALNVQLFFKLLALARLLNIIRKCLKKNIRSSMIRTTHDLVLEAP